METVYPAPRNIDARGTVGLIRGIEAWHARHNRPERTNDGKVYARVPIIVIHTRVRRVGHGT